MKKKVPNKNLHKAKTSKQDEFYSQFSDIEKELKHYIGHFKGKVALCNCDDLRISHFPHNFSFNFENLELKKLINTCYKIQNMDLFSKNDSEKAIYLEYTGDKDGDKIPSLEEIGIKYLDYDGDFRSGESTEQIEKNE